MQNPLPPNPNNLPLYDEIIGWYECDSEESPIMASIMHNPWGYPTSIEEAAMLAFRRKARFIEAYDINTEIETLIRQFFGNRTILQREGLSKQFIKLKEYVIAYNMIGLIWYGTDINRIDRVITDYTNVSGKEITLTINSICQTLIREYILEKNVDNLCKQTPHFEVYHKVVLSK